MPDDDARGLQDFADDLRTKMHELDMDVLEPVMQQDLPEHALSARLADRGREERGATAAEYAILAGFIAAVIIGTVAALGNEVVDLYKAIEPPWGEP